MSYCTAIDDRPGLEETCVRSAPEQLGIIIKSVIEGACWGRIHVISVASRLTACLGSSERVVVSGCTFAVIG